jgi:hypothetical protein
MRSLLLVESCDLRPSSEYVLVRLIPKLFPLCETVHMPGQSPVKVKPEIPDIFFLLGGGGGTVLFM